MVTYSSDELISSSEFAKKFGSYLSQIKDKSVDKIAILKNNTIEAVLVSKEEYEQMKQSALYEHERKIDEEISSRVESYKKGEMQTIPLYEGMEN